MGFWIAAILAPFVGGLHRYAVCYGYEGESRAEAWRQAKYVTAWVAVFSALFAAAKLFE